MTLAIRPVIDHLLDGDVDVAILMLLRLDRKQREMRSIEALPAPIPVDGKRPRSTSVDVSCPTCKARPGYPCWVMTRGGGANAKVIEPREAKNGYHSKRQERARSQS